MQSSFFSNVVALMCWFFAIVEFVLGANTVKEIIDTREDLKTIAGDRFLRGTDVMAYMGNIENKNLLFFAPHNSAIANMSNYLRNQLLSASSSTMNDLFSYHLAPNGTLDPSKLNGGTILRLRTKYKSAYIFVNKLPDGVTFINNAKILIPNLLSANGMVHIVDQMFVDVGPTNNVAGGLNAMDYMKGSSDLKELSTLYNTYQFQANLGTIQFSTPNSNAVSNYLAYSDSFCTLFAPNDAFISAYRMRNYDLYSKIAGLSSSTMKTVLDSLLIPNFSYHIETLEHLSSQNNINTNALLGWIKVYMLNGKYQVMNQCGQATVIQSNIVTTNCVIHVVDNFLGLVEKDLYNETMAQSDLKEFQTTIYSLQSKYLLNKLKVVGGAEYVVPAEQKYTLFAPTAPIFYYIDYSNDASIKAQQFSMTMVPGVIDLSSVTSSFKVNTLRDGYQATISRVGQDVFVEVDYVKARVVQSNICTRNGLIHKIDKILGVPEAMISEYLLRYPIYRQVYNTLQDTGLLTLFNNPTNQLTFLAPNASALSSLDPMFQGQQNKKKLRDLVSRHVIKSVVFLNESRLSESSMTFDTYNGQVVASYSKGAFYISVGQQKVKVIQPNMRMTNGVIHVVDNFLPYQASSADQSNLIYIFPYVHFTALLSFIFSYICR